MCHYGFYNWPKLALKLLVSNFSYLKCRFGHGMCMIISPKWIVGEASDVAGCLNLCVWGRCAWEHVYAHQLRIRLFWLVRLLILFVVLLFCGTILDYRNKIYLVRIEIENVCLVYFLFWFFFSFIGKDLCHRDTFKILFEYSFIIYFIKIKCFLLH